MKHHIVTLVVGQTDEQGDPMGWDWPNVIDGSAYCLSSWPVTPDYLGYLATRTKNDEEDS